MYIETGEATKANKQAKDIHLDFKRAKELWRYISLHFHEIAFSISFRLDIT